MAHKYKIFITRKIPDIGIKLLKEKGYNLKIYSQLKPIPQGELLRSVRGVDALCSLLTDKIDAKVMDAAGPQLKIIANFAVGFDNIDLKEAEKRKIFVTNTPGVLTEAVAEHTIALIFAVAKRLVEADKFVRAKKYKGWDPNLFLNQDLWNKTLGIIGLGRIGKWVGEVAFEGISMKILYYDVIRDEEFEMKTDAEFKPFKEVLKEADIITIHVPLLPSTHHLISEKEFKLMKKTAIFINTSRGPVVDEKALIKALKNKWIYGAGIDVYEHEPKLTPGLIDLDNVVLTPHTASATVKARNKMAELVANNIIAALEGRVPPNIAK